MDGPAVDERRTDLSMPLACLCRQRDRAGFVEHQLTVLSAISRAQAKVCVQGLSSSGRSGSNGPEILLESDKLLWSPGD